MPACSSGPQIVIDLQNIEPEDGDYRLKPRKIWQAKNGMQKENPPFQLFHIETRQQELANIILLCERFIDQMSAMPQIIQGQLGEVGTQQCAEHGDRHGAPAQFRQHGVSLDRQELR